jgi:hypothetical protein
MSNSKSAAYRYEATNSIGKESAGRILAYKASEQAALDRMSWEGPVYVAEANPLDREAPPKPSN